MHARPRHTDRQNKQTDGETDEYLGNSGMILLDHLKHVSSIIFMTLVYSTANLSLNIK